MKQEKKEYTLFSNVAYAYKNIWKTDKALVVTALGRIPLVLLSSLLAIYIPKMILDRLQYSSNITQIVLTILILLTASFLLNMIQQYVDAKKQISEHTMVNYYWIMVKQKTLSLDYEDLEKPESKILLEKAADACSSNNTAAMHLPTTFSTLAINILSFFLFGGIVYHLNPFLIVLIAGTTLVNYYLLKYLRNYNEKTKEDVAKVRRKIRYMRDISIEFSYAKDIRLYSMAGWIKNLQNLFIGEYGTIQNGYEKRNIRVSIVNACLTFLRDGISYVYLILQVVNGTISAGDFVLYFSAISQFAGFITEIIHIWGETQTASFQFNDMRQFFEHKNVFNIENGIALPEKKPLTIELQNVGYTYPKSEKPTLQGIHLSIKEGEKLAIVGLNGAGKTTLVKLICGMYSPTEGRILVGGHEINEYNRKEYYKLFSAVLQNFQFFPVSISRNISCEEEEKTNIDQVKECIELAGLKDKVSRFPEKEKTPLIKQINPLGTELSGGEAQKLLLARALYKDAPILILDEPTAALDPIAEDEIYQKYSQFTRNKTSIFISHRLASTRFCDRIILIEDGRILEEGTHEQLLSKKGKYAELFEVQSQYYKQKGGETIEKMEAGY